MKTRFLATTTTVLALAAWPALAQQTFTGSGDADGSAPNDGGAISSVVVNNDANNISFTINSTKAMASYIFYSIEIQDVGQGGSGYQGFSNPWGPSVGISTGENAIINTYGSGATPILYSGGSWAQGSGTSYAAGGTGSTFATITLPLSSLGLSAGSSFYFDVISSYTNPSSQAAYSALDNSGYIPESDGAYQPWNGNSHYDSATSAGSDFGTAATEYTVAVAAPEPSTFALMGVGALAMVRRALKRTA
jgi:hypothetical protein